MMGASHDWSSQRTRQATIYCCQEAAWMDEQVMLIWVEEVLAPYVVRAPEDIIPLLILDSY
jgi:hypothetical protein